MTAVGGNAGGPENAKAPALEHAGDGGLAFPRVLAFLVCVLAALLGRTAHADDDTRAEFRLDGRPHAGVPFGLSLVVEGFDQSPAPELPKLDIAGAKLTPASAAQPNVSRSIQIINGKRSESVRVTWVMQWRVVVDKEGSLHVPETTVSQGTKKATAPAGDIKVDSVPTADDMHLELGLPDRPVFIGETTKATLTWLFRRDPADRPQFSIPLMSLDEVTVSAPPVANKQQTIEIEAAGKTLQLPYTVDQTTFEGQKYNRLTVTFFLAPRKAGKIEMPPATVVAGLAVGEPDFFGNARSRLFRATDVPRTLEVRPLPEQDRPASFAGAVGSQFSFGVTASRSVVQLGEPVDLTIQVKSDQPLDTLALGRLDGDGGLPKDKFTVPQDPPTGELSDDNKTKTFKVTVGVAGPTNEIPAIAFAYFDPKTRTYQTIHSDPIALSVKSGNVVGANDVVGASPTRPKNQADADLPLVGDVDLALSMPSSVDATPLGGTLLWMLVGLLYAIPLAIFFTRSWQLRTANQREEQSEVRAARQRAEDALASANKLPARDAAGDLGAALRSLARVLGRPPADPVLAKLETESFAPGASTSPLPAEVRNEVRALITRWLYESRRDKSKLPRAAVIIALVALAAPRIAHADTTSPTARDNDELADGRAAYQEAMNASSASARKAAFVRAEAALGDAVRTHPDLPELLADWGNAALGAGDVATATLAYRRTLVLDPDNGRARRNLEWIRKRQADLYPIDAGGGARDTLFFFHSWPRALRMIVGGGAFALAVLLLVPWFGRRRGWQIGGAVVPAIVWLAMMMSVLLEDRHPDDAVVMDSVVLRAADSAGAPAVGQPLPRGAEVTIVERRDAWMKVRLPGGTSGWIPAGTATKVSPESDASADRR